MINKFRDFDFYRRIPKDLTESTAHGSALSMCAAVFMLVLFVCELWAFLSAQISTNVIIDPASEKLLRINFNITLPDVPCDFAVIDVIDVLGTRKFNVTKNINKWQIDSRGQRRNFEGKNTEQRDLMHDEHHDLHSLHENGQHAVHLGHNNQAFDQYVTDHKYVFVNFYAPWCIWCQRLEPVWEAFAQEADHQHINVRVASVDCVENRDLCMGQKVQAFPSLRMFQEGKPQPNGDYRSDRTVEALTEFVKNHISQDEQIAAMDEDTQRAHRERIESQRDDHPGCMMSGYLHVNRVPGNFHIEARSKHHNLNPVMSNITHIVNHLSFGPQLSRQQMRRVAEVPDKYFKSRDTAPMDDYQFVVDHLHTAHHHHIKVVSTKFEIGARHQGKDAILAYQMVQNSQIMQYGEEEIPEARFSYDISPMAVVISRKGKHWYEFITSICAIIGGTYTVISILNNFLAVIFKPKRV